VKYGRLWLKIAIIAAGCLSIPPLCFGLFVMATGVVFAGFEEPVGPLLLVGGAMVIASGVWLAYFRWLYLFNFPPQYR
jgi:hypothetical protein